MKYVIIAILVAGIVGYLSHNRRHQHGADGDLAGKNIIRNSNQSVVSPNTEKSEPLTQIKSSTSKSAAASIVQEALQQLRPSEASNQVIKSLDAAPITIPDKKLKLKLDSFNSKFTWENQAIDKKKFEEALSKDGTKTTEQIQNVLSNTPDSVNVLQPSPGEVKLNYSQVQVLSCPPVTELKDSMVVRFDSNGKSIDVEWVHQSVDPIPTFVYSCKFAPAMVGGVATPAVFIWPGTVAQYINNRPRSPAGN